MMKLIIGLGNPGKSYQRTRHNIGFWVIDRLASKTGIALSEEFCDSILGRGRLDGKTVVLAQPQTFMNRSGAAVGCLLAETASQAADLVVIFDDLDLPFGQVRIRSRGGAGGHRGMLSILEYLDVVDFPRVRLGIGRPPEGIDPADYVLQEFDATERAQVDEFVDQAADSVVCLIKNGIERAMALYNRARG